MSAKDHHKPFGVGVGSDAVRKYSMACMASGPLDKLVMLCTRLHDQ